MQGQSSGQVINKNKTDPLRAVAVIILMRKWIGHTTVSAI